MITDRKSAINTNLEAEKQLEADLFDDEYADINSTEAYLDNLDGPTADEISEIEAATEYEIEPKNAKYDGELVVNHEVDGKDGRIDTDAPRSFQEDLFYQYMDEIHSSGLALSDQEQQELFEKIANGDEETKKWARNRLVEAHLGLVIAPVMAWKTSMRGKMTLMDLVQEGNIGLMKGIEKFKPELGFRLSTYAMWWIRQAISIAVADQSRTIRMPVHAHEKSNKVFRASSALKVELGRQPTDEEIAKRTGETVEKIGDIRHFNTVTNPISLQTIIHTDKGDKKEFGDMIIDEDSGDLEDIVIGDILAENVRDVLGKIKTSARNLEIFKMRFGIGYSDGRTLEAVGEHFGITRERVRQIEADIINKLRKNPSVEKLKAA
ncbi:MAG: RNA polymerase sigma factor RpoD/SigA [Candidatus Nomurabacteria bacterium]|nr:RNA polymerase sigma factor RpoD/SigA [Candidatus Nomurabacteria bacterium]